MNVKVLVPKGCKIEIECVGRGETFVVSNIEHMTGTNVYVYAFGEDNYGRNATIWDKEISNEQD